MNEHARIKQPATYQDVLDAPENMVAQIVHGVLHTQPRPTMSHVRVSSVLGRRIGGPYDDDIDGPGGWWIVEEPELHLGDDIVVPDVAGWRRERMPEYPDTAFCTVAPDWVCEVLSPSTRRLDLTGKREVYGAHGVAHLWFVDPDAKTLEAFELREGAWTLIAALQADADVSVPPFDAVSFSLGVLWP